MASFVTTGILGDPVCLAHSLGCSQFFKERGQVNENDCFDPCRFSKTTAHILLGDSYCDPHTDLAPSALTLGDIEIFPEHRRVTKAGVEICLNYGEFSILYCMARCPGRVFSREQLYNAAWGEDYELGTNTVDNTIWRLRNKLEPDPKHPTYIKTVFRVGYKIDR